MTIEAPILSLTLARTRLATARQVHDAAVDACAMAERLNGTDSPEAFAPAKSLPDLLAKVGAVLDGATHPDTVEAFRADPARVADPRCDLVVELGARWRVPSGTG